jgi:hypothetical protein
MARFSHLNDVFIIKDTDEKGTYTLAEAKALCTTLTEGFRIPTLTELETVYTVCMEQGIQKLTGELKFKTKNYLTDTVDEYDGWPLSFDFNDGVSYLSSEKSKHSLRLVRNEVSSYSENKLSKEDFILKTSSVIKKYIPSLSEEKFTSFLKESLEPVTINFSEIRYVTLEDYNMCSYPEDFYVAHFHSDNDLVTIWEDDFFAGGYNLDELDDEAEGIRETYIAFIDLLDQKYIRINGFGDQIEYGSENPTDEHPDWKGWC